MKRTRPSQRPRPRDTVRPARVALPHGNESPATREPGEGHRRRGASGGGELEKARQPGRASRRNWLIDLPELNPVERIWLYLRERFLSLRFLPDTEAIVEACCHAWNALSAEPGRIPSLCAYPWIMKLGS